MSMQDPISDLLTRIRNGQMAKKGHISVPGSKVKSAVLNVLLQEGYISSVEKEDVDGKATIKIGLKYYEGKPVIEKIERVSRPGLRVYKGSEELPKVRDGLGVAIISTCKGVITDKTARKEGIGGEVLCSVY